MEGLTTAGGGAGYEGERKVGRERKRKLLEWDRLLKDFRYSDALDAVLRKVISSSVFSFSLLSLLVSHANPSPDAQQSVTPATTFALLEELIHRAGLPLALANRHDLSLEPILRFLVKHITNPRYCVLAADVAVVLIGSSSLFSRSVPFTPLKRADPTPKRLDQRSTPQL